MPPTFLHRGQRFDRVTIQFKGGPSASQARALVQDVLHRAHGFRTARNLTDRLAQGGGRFRVVIARRMIGRLRRRLRLLVEAGLIRLFIAGRLVKG